MLGGLQHPKASSFRLFFAINILVNFGTFKPGKKKVYNTTVETLFFSFSGSEASMVYALLSGPMVYTLFPCFPRKMVYTISFFCSVTSGSGDRPRKEGCHGGGVYSTTPCKQGVIKQKDNDVRVATGMTI